MEQLVIIYLPECGYNEKTPMFLPIINICQNGMEVFSVHVN